MDSLPGVIPPRQRRQYCQHKRPAHCVRFILLSVCPPLFSVPHSIEYTHIIAYRQNNASGLCGFAYNVIYIKRRFSCVVLTKTACAIGYFVVQLSQIWKTHKLFFRNPFVQILWLIVQIPDFTFCSLWLKSKADTIAYLVIITYLLSNSQRQCVSTAYNTPPGVSRLFEPWTIYGCVYLYSCATLLVFVLALPCFPSLIIYIIPRGRMIRPIEHLVLNTISSNIRFTFQNIWNGIDFLAFAGNRPVFVFIGNFSVFCFFFGKILYFSVLPVNKYI